MKKAFPILSCSLLAVVSMALSTTARAQDPKTVEKSASAYKSERNDSKSQSGASENGSTQPKGNSKTGDSSEGLRSNSDAGDAQKFYDSGMGLIQQGHLTEAIEALSQAAKLRPDDPQIQYSLGMAYLQVKSYKEAAESFKRAVKSKPDWPEANFRMGMMSYVLGRKSLAIESYNKLLKLESPLANTLYRIIREDSGSNSNEANVQPVNPVETSTVSLSTKEREVPPPTPTETSAPPRENIAAKPEPKSAVSPVPNPPETKPVSNDQPLTNIYRVGIGDILDIRFLNSTPRSTLFTVIDGGVIDLPIAGGPVAVAGLTCEQIQNRISAELKRRAVESNALVTVSVRQYSSHTVIVTGLVSNPGTRTLRREAVPLYVLMAEVQPRADAGRITILRAGSEGQTIDLNNAADLSALILPGDVINVAPKPQEFYYIGGRVNYPGQKPFQTGITLVQAILAAGGLSQNDNNIDVSREGAGGRLATTRYSLKDIKSGKTQDPRLQPGDRIEVVH